MAIDRDPNMPGTGSTMPPRDSTMYDADPVTTGATNTVYENDARTYNRDTGGSNFWAFLIGGLVIAIGLMAFLFYDGGATTGQDVSTTSSTTPRVETPASPAAPSASSPSTAPSTPATPATPSRPANPQ